LWAITGHSKAVTFLERSLQKDAMAHAYLFTGLPHIGKMTLALALAQSLNCQSGVKPCGSCSQCSKIGSLSHPDVQVIGILSATESEDGRARTEIIIDQIRKIRHWASLPPYEGEHRVFIIDPAEMLSLEAANCLLKTLEEPLGKVLFVLLSAEPERLPETVVSRCQRIDLHPVQPVDIEETLVARSVEPEKARLLSFLCHGAPGLALTAAEDGAWLEKRQETLEHIIEVIHASYAERFEYASELATRFSQKKPEVRAILDQWLDVWRDIMLLQTGAGDNLINLDYKEKLISMTNSLSLVDISCFLAHLKLAQKHLRQNISPQLVLEVLMLDMPVISKSVTARKI
jgi:DNA polymerase-3 subunit delta'